MASKISLNINFLANPSARSGSLSKPPMFAVSLAGTAFSLIMIAFLAFNLLGQGFHAKTTSQSIISLKQAHLPINLNRPESIHLAEVPAKPANRQPAKNQINNQSVKPAQNITFTKPASLSARLAETLASLELRRSGPAKRADQIRSGLPIRLKIPKINVDAALEQVGLTSDGSMDVPKGRDNAAWFKFGPRPGDNNSAVIAGHYGYWKDGKKSVFNDLNKLKGGDKLYIKDETEATTAFIVRASRSYDQNADASGIFSSNDGQSHLILITCDGVWNKAAKSYPQRLVVFADKMDLTLSMN